jgi:hypothetical protein
MVFLLRTSFEMKSKQPYHRHRIQTRIKTVSDCNSHRDGSKNRTQGNETQGNETQRRKDARVQREEEEEEEEEKRGEEWSAGAGAGAGEDREGEIGPSYLTHPPYP